jgi:hypothetical protein
VFTLWENQTGRSIKWAGMDNGGEHKNQGIQEYFSAKGIRAEYTAPYSPEQNGMYERLNRIIMDKVRSMLADAKMSGKVWAEAAETANYLRDLSPTVGRSKTPHESFFGRKPDVSHLRAFGSPAYVLVPKSLRKILDPRCVKGHLVGYTGGAYRVSMKDGKIRVARSIVFDETHVGSFHTHDVVTQNDISYRVVDSYLELEGCDWLDTDDQEEIVAAPDANQEENGNSDLQQEPQEVVEHVPVVENVPIVENVPYTMKEYQ